VNVEPGGFGGIESQLATNDPASFAAVYDLAFTYKERFRGRRFRVHALITDLHPAAAEMAAASQEPERPNGTTSSSRSAYRAAMVTDSIFSLWRPLRIQRIRYVILNITPYPLEQMHGRH
jgi:hypothetical protein